MQSSPPDGFRKIGNDIYFSFLDDTGAAHALGPIASLERFQDDNFTLQTAQGRTHRVKLSLDHVSEFLRLGGAVRPPHSAEHSNRPDSHWGFQNTASGLFLWYRRKDAVKYLGPVITLEHLGEDRYSLIAKDVRQGIRLTPEKLAEFRRLGGKVSQLVPESLPAPIKAGRDNHDGLRWKGLGEQVKVGPYMIVDPLTYFSHSPPTEEEGCCIDLSLPIGEPVVEARGALGYWPQYSRLSPEQRANYLAWLASERNGDLDDIGYAFLYLYGLERRILLDDRDINPVTLEIVRLLNRYTFSGSFTGYLSRLLAYVIARTGLEKLREAWFEQIFEKSPLLPDDSILALALAWHVRRGKVLGARWAMRLAKQHPHAPRSVVEERAPIEFQTLFAKKYEDRFGNGLELQVAKRDRTIQYSQPASPSLLKLRSANANFSEGVSIPNVLGLQSQFLPLVKIMEECIRDLKPLSRRLAQGAEVTCRKAYELLPEGLKTEMEHPDKPAWDAVVAKHTAEDGVVVIPVSKLAELHGLPPRSRLTARQSESLAQTANYVGYCVEPDIRITRRPYRSNDVLALFRPEGDSWVPTGNRYASAALILELGLVVVAADGTIADEKGRAVSRFVEDQFGLDVGEARRLKQLRQILFLQGPSPDRINQLAVLVNDKRLHGLLNAPERETLARFFLGLAGAGGELGAPAVRMLRRIYRALDVDGAGLDALLQEFRTRAGVPVGMKGPENGQGLSPRNASADQNLMRTIMGDTAAVAGMLDQVLGLDENSEENEAGEASIRQGQLQAAEATARTASRRSPPKLVQQVDKHLEIMELTIQFAFAVARVDGGVPSAAKAIIEEHVRKRYQYHTAFFNRARAMCAHYFSAAIDLEGCLRRIRGQFTVPHRIMMLKLAVEIVDAAKPADARRTDLLEKVSRILEVPLPVVALRSQAASEANPPPAPDWARVPQAELDPRVVLEIDAASQLTADLIRRQFNRVWERLDPKKMAGIGSEFVAMAQIKRAALRDAAFALIAPFGEDLEPKDVHPQNADLRENAALDQFFGV